MSRAMAMAVWSSLNRSARSIRSRGARPPSAFSSASSRSRSSKAASGRSALEARTRRIDPAAPVVVQRVAHLLPLGRLATVGPSVAPPIAVHAHPTRHHDQPRRESGPPVVGEVAEARELVRAEALEHLGVRIARIVLAPQHGARGMQQESVECSKKVRPGGVPLRVGPRLEKALQLTWVGDGDDSLLARCRHVLEVTTRPQSPGTIP